MQPPDDQRKTETEAPDEAHPAPKKRQIRKKTPSQYINAKRSDRIPWGVSFFAKYIRFVLFVESQAR
jgi:hypothetical protein